MANVARDVVELRVQGWTVVVVTSGAITAGWSEVGQGRPRPSDSVSLQAVSAVGQPLLMHAWRDAFGELGASVGQVLLAPLDFSHRGQYLHARGTLEALHALNVVPIVNENDAVADEEIRFGDNDRLAALVANLVGASHLVLLTDTAGLFTADPRLDPTRDADRRGDAPSTAELVDAAGASRSGVGQRRHGLEARGRTHGDVVGHDDGDRPGARAATPCCHAVNDAPGFGTTFHPRPERLSARKSWIAFAVASQRIAPHQSKAPCRRSSTTDAVCCASASSHQSATSSKATPSRSRGPRARSSRRVSCASSAESFDEGDDVVVHRDDLVLLTSLLMAPITIAPCH